MLDCQVLIDFLLYNFFMLGQKIKNLIKNNNITQKKLAEDLNITPQAVSLWIKDKADPDLLNLKEIALYFNVTTDYLLDIEDEFGNRITQNKSNNEYFIYNDGTHYIKHKKN